MIETFFQHKSLFSSYFDLFSTYFPDFQKPYFDLLFHCLLFFRGCGACSRFVASRIKCQERKISLKRTFSGRMLRGYLGHSGGFRNLGGSFFAYS